MALSSFAIILKLPEIVAIGVTDRVRQSELTADDSLPSLLLP